MKETKAWEVKSFLGCVCSQGCLRNKGWARSCFRWNNCSQERRVCVLAGEMQLLSGKLLLLMGMLQGELTAAFQCLGKNREMDF